ncbi:YqcC family protein [Oceanisphaera pacifica]|uniref:YqcC family protein n=1 Tax=Oceanisphaera pacifica TaxID=2818389 RepID=A0ABS3NJ44_9GAMM|nr:YqcC family protein [Oceanisphaera pacifica]MBO1520602.1 YqcC family protein [Oceanisphaera pacifica]
MSADAQRCLSAIVDELKALSWWQTEPPSAAALSSSQPFCIDTLTFAQWLQFVLIARLQAMLESGAPLPQQISVYPMATESFKSVAENTQALEEAIAQLDECLSGLPVVREA